MRSSTPFVGCFLLAGALGIAASASAADGKEIFLAQKCNMCHAVSSAGIEATTKSASMKGPDLAGALKTLDPVWVADFIKKKVDKDGKKHTKEFKGSDEDLTALIDWLKTQNKS